MTVRPIEWMRLVRDALPPYTNDRITVLWALALRMSRDGTGYASTRQLGDDSRSGERTVERATADARQRGHLIRTRRGHRLGNGQSVANEWALMWPESLPDSTDGLTSQADTTDGLSDLNPSDEAAQPVTTAAPRAPTTRALTAAARAAQTVAKHTDASPAEAAEVAALIQREKQPRNLPAFVNRLGVDGELPDWLERVRIEGVKRIDEEADRRARSGPECVHGTRGGNDPTHPRCTHCKRARERGA